jgi:pimeloyl-ACP methyl ester carboxylesterase
MTEFDTRPVSAVDRRVSVGPVTLTISEAGRGGRPLLLVHGFTGARSDFEDFLVPLAERGWHVVAPDLRGHGESDQPTEESAYSFERFADDLLALVDVLGWSRLVLLGHSMGGMVAQVLARRAPERLDALILMDTGPGPVAIDPGLVELGVAAARSEGMDFIAGVMATMEDDPLTSEPYRRKVAEDPSYAARGDRNLRASSPAMYAAMLVAITSSPDRLAELAAVAVPTLVLVGEQDEPFRAASSAMAETIGGAELAVLPGGGHSPQFEAPEVWWDALAGFLDRLPG